MADVHREHRRRVSARLLHHPPAGTAAAVQLSTAPAGYRTVRRADHLLDDAGRDAADARASPLRPGDQLRTGERRGGVCRGLPGDGPGATGAGAQMSVAVWAGVAVIGGFGAIARFMIDRAVARRVA